MAAAPTPGSTPGSSTGPATGLSPAARRGYGLGSVATGSFGTVPGLLLLPYLTDRLGVAAGVAGLVVFLPKAWDVILNPIAGRISDRSTNPGGRRRPFLIRSGTPAGPRLRAALRRADLPDGPGHHLGRRPVPRVRHGLRVLPGALRRDARRDDRRLRRAHPADDLAGGDPRPDDPGQRRPLAGHPQRARPRVGLPRRRPLRRRPDPGRHGRRVVGHPQHPHERRRDRRRQPAPTSCGWWRHRASSARCSPSSCSRRSPPGRCSPASTTSRGCCSAASGASTILFVCFVAPALLVTPLWQRVGEARGKRTGYLWGSLLLAGGALATLLTVRVGVAATAASVAVVGVGYAACQMFPLAMLPDVAAADTARTGESRAGTYTGVWTAGETLGLALGPFLYAGVLAAGRLRLVDRCRRRPARLGAHRDRAGLHRRPGRARRGLPAGPAQVPARPGGAPMTPPTSTPTTDEVLATLRTLQALDLPAHGGRTLAYVYDSGLADADAVGLEALAMFAVVERPRPHRLPLAAADGERPRRAGRRAPRRPGRVRRVGHLRRHRVDPARRARRPAGRRRRPTRAWSSPPRPTRRSTRRPSTWGCAPSSSTSTPARCAPTPPPWPRRSTTPPCSSSPRPRPTRTGSSTRSPRSPPWRPSAASAATSTRASAAGCCRTSTTPRRGPSPSRASRASASTCTSTPTRPRASRCCSTAPRPCARGHFFASADWPGYTMLNSTMQSTRSGGPLAAAWAVTQRIGLEGYARLARQARDATLAVADAVDGIPGLRVLAAAGLDPRRPGRRRVVRRLHRRRRDARARVVRAAADVVPATCRRPSTSPCRPPPPRRCPSCVEALRGFGRRRPGRRPGRGRPGPRRRSLGVDRPRDPRRRRASPGCSPPPASPAATAPSPCPRRMAPVNALLDACPPPLREALLLGVLDRLSRPTPAT